MNLISAALLLALTGGAWAQLPLVQASATALSEQLKPDDRPGHKPALASAGRGNAVPARPLDADPAMAQASVGTTGQADHGSRDPKAHLQADGAWGVAEWAAIAQAICAIVMTAFTLLLLRTSNATARIAADSLTVSREALNTTNATAAKNARAYLYVTQLDLVYNALSSDGENLVTIQFRNFGRTPCQLIDAGIRVVEGDRSPAIAFINEGYGSIIGPDAACDAQFGFRLSDGDAVHAGTRPLSLVVVAKYTDMDGASHTTLEEFRFSSEAYGFHPNTRSSERLRT